MNDNVRMLSEAVEYFIQRYDAAKMKIKDKTVSPLTITIEDLKNHIFSRKSNVKIKKQ